MEYNCLLGIIILPTIMQLAYVFAVVGVKVCGWFVKAVKIVSKCVTEFNCVLSLEYSLYLHHIITLTLSSVKVC